MTFYSVFVNLRKKYALDCCTITNLNEMKHNSPIAWWIVDCFQHSKDVGSSPVASKYFFFHFCFRFASVSVFILDFVHNWIHLFEFGMRLCNKYCTVNNFNNLCTLNIF